MEEAYPIHSGPVPRPEDFIIEEHNHPHELEGKIRTVDNIDDLCRILDKTAPYLPAKEEMTEIQKSLSKLSEIMCLVSNRSMFKWYAKDIEFRKEPWTTRVRESLPEDISEELCRKLEEEFY